MNVVAVPSVVFTSLSYLLLRTVFRLGCLWMILRVGRSHELSRDSTTVHSDCFFGHLQRAPFLESAETLHRSLLILADPEGGR
jgi:hypothetical protein